MLYDILEKLLAETFVLRLKAQFCHWNVTGQNFHEYHGFFGSLYEELDSAVDVIAELIRQIDRIAPASMQKYLNVSSIHCMEAAPSATEMLDILADDNKKILLTLYSAYKEAESLGELGISNIIQDRISIHHKHDWMLRAFNK